MLSKISTKINLKTQTFNKIPVCEPLFLGRETDYVLDAVRSGWVSSKGPYLKKFEDQFSAFCGRPYGIATTSGTAALHLVLKALGIGKDDEVIVPDFTMVALLFAVLYCGAKPVFVDADPVTWNMDVSKIASKINPKTKAILAAHIYGHPCDMDPLLNLAKRHGLKVIEDAAEAHGALYKGKRVGGMGDISCFSFYGNKIITTGEGGMVVTGDAALAERCRYYGNLCFPMDATRQYRHEEVGYNYRMTNIQAALGLAQLENIDTLIQKKRDNAALYRQQLEKIEGLQLPPESKDAQSVFWMYGLVIDPKKIKPTRDRLCEFLAERGVETRPFFMPMHRQKMVAKEYANLEKDYPVSNLLSEFGFYLPSGAGLTSENIETVCEAIHAAIIS